MNEDAYTPTTDEIKERYAQHAGNFADRHEARQEFERWLQSLGRTANEEQDWRPNLRDESKPYPEYGWVRTVSHSEWREATRDEAGAQGVFDHAEDCQIRTGWSRSGPHCTCDSSR